ncbi:MAG: hypothetical protein RL591_1841 [Planctomycetota bacterium]
MASTFFIAGIVSPDRADAASAHAMALSSQDALPAGSALVRAAMDRMGGENWRKISSFQSVATAKSAMGEAKIEYRFVAPDARLLLQTMPSAPTGANGVAAPARTMELGVANGLAWMGEPGQARAVDPKMAEELAGGGDLQTLVRSIEERFEDFQTTSRESINGRIVWRITMTPRTTATPDARWTLFIDAATGLIHGFDIPAPPNDMRANAPTPSGQSIRLDDWKPAELGPGCTLQRLIAFRTANVSAGGMETELVYTTVAVDTLKPDAIRAPSGIEPPATPQATPPATAPATAPATSGARD